MHPRAAGGDASASALSLFSHPVRTVVVGCADYELVCNWRMALCSPDSERYIYGTWWTSHAYMHVMINIAYNCQFQYLINQN